MCQMGGNAVAEERFPLGILEVIKYTIAALLVEL
jgi:hypothetical protein